MSNQNAETESLGLGPLHSADYDPTGAYEEPFVPKQRYRPATSTKILACAVLIMAGVFGVTFAQKTLVPSQSGARSNVSQLRNGGSSTGDQGGATQTRGARGGQGQRPGQANP